MILLLKAKEKKIVETDSNETESNESNETESKCWIMFLFRVA